jgi:anthranilate synthase component II
MVDNYDSFTFNLVHYLQQLDTDEMSVEVLVIRNDELNISDIELLAPTHIVLSPGPCNPDKAGLCLKIVESFYKSIPILGVCLGHQVIGQFFGAKVIKANQVVHGKTSRIHHTGKGVFKSLEQAFTATRYHSLVLEKSSMPECLEITAWTESSGHAEYIMGIKHLEYPIEGVQFHPESILSEHGLILLKRFVTSN